MARKAKWGYNRKGRRMTAKQRAALRKAQAASARKRRGKGKSAKSYSKGKTRRRLKTAAKVAGTAAAVGAVAYAHHQGQKKKWARTAANVKRNQAYAASMAKRFDKPKMKHRKKAHAMSGGPTRHNRVFVTNRYGKTSVRKRHV